MSKPKVAFLLPVYFGSNHSMFLGVGYLSAVLKKNGNDTLIIDEDTIYWLYKQNECDNILEKVKNRIISEINKFSPDIICISINTTNYNNALNLLMLVNSFFKDVYIVVGGPHITTSFESFDKWHHSLFDAAIIGEGEESLCELCNWFEQKEEQRIIPGVRFASYPQLYKKRSVVNIDSIPYPDREGFFKIFTENELPIAKDNYNRVFYSHLPGFKDGYARIVASRGCYNSCNFCSPGIYWRNPINNKPCRRVRNPISIVDEIEQLINQGIHAFYFDDPTFPIKSDLNFFKMFEEEIKRRELDFSWGAPICSSEIDYELLDRLSMIGFTYTYFGLENYKIENLKKMHKSQNIESCTDLIFECKKRNIHCDASYQIGLPGEDFEEIKRSINWIFDSKIERNAFYSITAIWPETELAKEYSVPSDAYEPSFDKKAFYDITGLFYYKQGNSILEDFFSNCSGTYHFIPEETAINAKYYCFDMGLRNRFANNL